MAFAVPIMDTTRAREELGWEPRKTSEDAFRELLEGMQGRREAGYYAGARRGQALGLRPRPWSLVLSPWFLLGSAGCA